MRSKHRLVFSVSFIALTAVLLFAALAVQASARHTSEEGNAFVARFPPKGSVYTVNIAGAAKAQDQTVKQASADLELKVVYVKTKGVPTIYYKLLGGQISLDADTYSLESGGAVILGTSMVIKATSMDGTKVLRVYASLGGPLSISASEEPTSLLPGEDRRSVTIQVIAAKLTMNNFSGSLTRTE